MYFTLLKKIIGKENLEFLAHAKNYFTADLLTVALGFVSLPILTRLLEPNEYGILAIFSSLLSITVILLNLNIDSGIKRYYFENSSDFYMVLGSNIIFLGCFNVLLGFLLFGLRKILAPMIGIDTNLFLLAIVVTILMIPGKLLLGYLQATKNSKKYSVLSACININILWIAILLMFMLKEDKYMGKVYAQLIIQGVFFLYACFVLQKLSRFSFKWSHLKYTLSFSLPLLPAALSAFVLGYFDRIIIQQLTNSTYTGLYSLAYNVGMLMNVIVLASNKSWQPIFMEQMTKKEYKKIDDLVYNYSNYIYFCAASLILFSKEIIIIMADKKYYAALSLIPIIVIGYIFFFLYTIYFQYVIYRKKTILTSVTSIFAGVVNIVLNYWLIPKYGYMVAAYNTVISYFLLFVLNYISANFILKERTVSLRRILPNSTMVILITIVYYLITSYVDNYIIGLFVKIVIFLYLLFCIFIKKGNTILALIKR